MNAGHCSCHGLEGQWEPEETTVVALRHRLADGRLGRKWSYGGTKGKNKFADELEDALDALELLKQAA